MVVADADIREQRPHGHPDHDSEITVGWWYGTPRYEPFFEMRIDGAMPTLHASSSSP